MTAVPLKAKDEGQLEGRRFRGRHHLEPDNQQRTPLPYAGLARLRAADRLPVRHRGTGVDLYDADIGSSGNIVGLGSTGAQVFRALAGVVMATVALVVPGLVGPTISGERERQTLNLLLVTPLGPARIVLGKLVAALAFVVLLVIACLPCSAWRSSSVVSESAKCSRWWPSHWSGL